MSNIKPEPKFTPTPGVPTAAPPIFHCPDRVRLALNGPYGEVLRLIALQPIKPSTSPPNGKPIQVPRR